MLQIATDLFPQSCLSYLAFRIAFHETYERIVLARQMGDDAPEGFGYLTEVPFFQAVPPQVQLDLLAQTWSRHIDSRQFEANLIDESVVYAACETAANLIEDDPSSAMRYVQSGPVDLRVTLDHFLASELRALHLSLSNDGDFLMISQFEDMQPEQAIEVKQSFRLDERQLDLMFEILGRWHVSPAFPSSLRQLLTEQEIPWVVSSLKVRQPCDEPDA